MSLLDAGGREGPAAGLPLILVFATAVAGAWLAIVLASLFI